MMTSQLHHLYIIHTASAMLCGIGVASTFTAGFRPIGVVSFPAFTV